MRQHREGHACGADGRAIDIRDPSFHGQVVGQVTRFEIVEPVDHDIDAVREALDVRVVDVIDDRGHPDVGVGPGDTSLRGLRFRQSIGDVLLIEQHLALQVRQFHDVAIDDHEMTDAGARQHFSGDTTERPAAEYQRSRVGQPLLALPAEAGQQHLALVS